MFDFFIRSRKVLEIHNLVYAIQRFPVKLEYFSEENFAHPRCKTHANVKLFLCMNNILLILFLYFECYFSACKSYLVILQSLVVETSIK